MPVEAKCSVCGEPIERKGLVWRHVHGRKNHRPRPKKEMA